MKWHQTKYDGEMSTGGCADQPHYAFASTRLWRAYLEDSDDGFATGLDANQRAAEAALRSLIEQVAAELGLRLVPADVCRQAAGALRSDILFNRDSLADALDPPGGDT